MATKVAFFIFTILEGVATLPPTPNINPTPTPISPGAAAPIDHALGILCVALLTNLINPHCLLCNALPLNGGYARPLPKWR